ncbi:hypothetical protein J6590_052337 [Homalodisca vitripennis]|nr:hypothetical protein J6590_052337 [Homalodisca vitripennis]
MESSSNVTRPEDWFLGAPPPPGAAALHPKISRCAQNLYLAPPSRIMNVLAVARLRKILSPIIPVHYDTGPVFMTGRETVAAAGSSLRHPLTSTYRDRDLSQPLAAGAGTSPQSLIPDPAPCWAAAPLYSCYLA